MQNAETVLSVLNQKSKENPQFVFQRLYRNMYNKDLYWNAYYKIASKERNLTKGMDNHTINSFLEEKIEKIIELMRTETYYPKPIRKEYIQNKNMKQRTLGISDFNDKLVQQVIREILESIYEPQFLDTSHGFRPNQSCHTALYQIKKDWIGVKWIIEGDISSFFDNISHNKLIQILNKKINDNRFLRLIKRFLKAGYIDNWKKHETYSGTPQGEIISPILANIYLHEFDLYIEEICKNWTYGKRRKTNPEYNRANGRYNYYKKTGQLEKAKQYKKTRDELYMLDQMDEDYSRVKYIRYADDFLIGVWNNKETAINIKENINEFLKNELEIELNHEKTLITNAKDKRVRFLGYEIAKSASENIQLLVPNDIVNKHISKYTKNGKAVHIPQRANQSEFHIISQYNSEIRRLYNYYSLATDVSTKVNKVRYYHYDSLVKTLAFKHKCSYKQVIDKFGIEVPLKNNKTGTRKLVGIQYKTKNKIKTLTYFNESLKKKEKPIINLVDRNCLMNLSNV